MFLPILENFQFIFWLSQSLISAAAVAAMWNQLFATVLARQRAFPLPRIWLRFFAILVRIHIWKTTSKQSNHSFGENP